MHISALLFNLACMISLQVPEGDLHYTVSLTNVSGDGVLAASSTQARLTVRHNDDPINLRDSALEAREGEVIELIVYRGGHANGKYGDNQCKLKTYFA